MTIMYRSIIFLIRHIPAPELSIIYVGLSVCRFVYPPAVYLSIRRPFGHAAKLPFDRYVYPSPSVGHASLCVYLSAKLFLLVCCRSVQPSCCRPVSSTAQSTSQSVGQSAVSCPPHTKSNTQLLAGIDSTRQLKTVTRGTLSCPGIKVHCTYSH